MCMLYLPEESCCNWLFNVISQGKETVLQEWLLEIAKMFIILSNIMQLNGAMHDVPDSIFLTAENGVYKKVCFIHALLVSWGKGGFSENCLQSAECHKCSEHFNAGGQILLSLFNKFANGGANKGNKKSANYIARQRFPEWATRAALIIAPFAALNNLPLSLFNNQRALAVWRVSVCERERLSSARQRVINSDYLYSGLTARVIIDMLISRRGEIKSRISSRDARCSFSESDTHEPSVQHKNLTNCVLRLNNELVAERGN